MKKKIGVFDSGIGGVTVLKEILKVLPKEDYIYYSDSKNNPYGDKEDEQIIKYCDNIMKFLLKQNCKAIVIACNTASAKAADYLRKKYANIPIIAIEPAYKMVHDFAYDKPTLVMATKGTIESEKFNMLYNKYDNHKTQLVPCVGLADLIEEDREKEIDDYLEKNIGKYKGNVKNVVLGCTHYPIIKNKIERVLGEVEFFDGAEKLAEHVKKVLEKNGNTNKGKGQIMFIDSQNLKKKEIRFFEILKMK